MSDSKLASFVKSKLCPLEGGLAQLQADFTVLKETQQEQNAVLSRLVDKFEDLPGNKLDKISCDQDLETLRESYKRNRHRLETLEIGQGNLKLAIRELSKTIANSAQQNVRVHNEPPARTSRASEINNDDPRHSTYQAVRHQLKQTGSGSPGTYQENSRHDSVSTPTSHSASNATIIQNESETATWAEKASMVSNKHYDKNFTLATKANAKNHKEPPNIASSGHQRELGPRISRQHQESRSIPGDQKSPTSDQYRKYTVLLVHDENFKNFNPPSFNAQFNVHQFSATSFLDLEKKRKQLNNMMKRLHPDCIYIHLGINDFMEKKSSASSAVHDLADHLLKSTNAKICFSLLVPSSNDVEINDQIQLVNNEVKSNISWFRNSDETYKSRLFTFPNYQVRHQNVYSSNTGFDLTERGEKMLYIRLREGIKKSLRINRVSYHNNKKPSQHSKNRFSDD